MSEIIGAQNTPKTYGDQSNILLSSSHQKYAFLTQNRVLIHTYTERIEKRLQYQFRIIEHLSLGEFSTPNTENE